MSKSPNGVITQHLIINYFFKEVKVVHYIEVPALNAAYLTTDYSTVKTKLLDKAGWKSTFPYAFKIESSQTEPHTEEFIHFLAGLPHEVVASVGGGQASTVSDMAQDAPG
jgi:hypothetical protein